MDDVRIYSGTLAADLLLPGARALKERRAPLRSLIQRLQNHDFAVAQVGPPDLVQRVFLAICAVNGDNGVLEARLDAAERLVYASEFEVADLRRIVTVETYPSG